MTLKEEQVLEALKTVIDPEIGINIVDIGLVYSLEIEEGRIFVTMTLTTPGCPMHSSIVSWVKECLMQLDPNLNVDVNLVWQPQWTPHKMSDEAKRQLGFN
ncbi:MAG: metal-sulfur cluster assembly factor [Ignavibacteriales bacterium]